MSITEATNITKLPEGHYFVFGSNEAEGTEKGLHCVLRSILGQFMDKDVGNKEGVTLSLQRTLLFVLCLLTRLQRM